MKISSTALATLAIALATTAVASAAPKLVTYDYCAGSPLTMGSAFSGGGRIDDISVIANADGTPVGWLYRSSLGKRFVQASAKMPAADQAALHVRAGDGVSGLHARPATLPDGLTARACRASEIARY